MLVPLANSVTEGPQPMEGIDSIALNVCLSRFEGINYCVV